MSHSERDPLNGLGPCEAAVPKPLKIKWGFSIGEDENGHYQSRKVSSKIRNWDYDETYAPVDEVATI